MFVNKHVLDVIVVVVISSVCYIDHLLCHDFLGSNSSGFSAKKEKEKKTGKKDVSTEESESDEGPASSTSEKPDSGDDQAGKKDDNCGPPAGVEVAKCSLSPALALTA